MTPDRSGARKGFSALFIIPFAAVALALVFASLDRPYRPLDRKVFFLGSLRHSVPLAAAYLLAWFAAMQDPARRRKGWLAPAVLACVFLPMAVEAAEIYWNGSRDTGEPAVHTVPLLSKFKRTGKHTTYYVRTGTWREGRADETFAVPRYFYQNVAAGTTELRIVTRPGALGQEWVQSFEELRGERPVPVSALKTEEVYRRLGVTRSRFDSAQSRMDGVESAYLAQMLDLCEAAMLARMSAMDNLYKTGAAEADLTAYESRMTELASLAAPGRLSNVRRLVLEAMGEQLQYLREWAAKHKKSIWPKFDEPLIRSSNTKLISAYNELMKLYPSENASNQRAFHDTLCALDFI